MQAHLPPHMGQPSDLYDPWVTAWFSAGLQVLSARQVPIGILAAELPASLSASQGLALEVHFTQRWPDGVCPFALPSDVQARAPLLCNPRHMFFNTLKEACLIRTGAGPLARSCAVPLAASYVS